MPSVCHLFSFLLGLAYASGLAATLNITHLLKAGDTIVCMDDVYGGTSSTSVFLIFIVQMVRCACVWFSWNFWISHVGPYFSPKPSRLCQNTEHSCLILVLEIQTRKYSVVQCGGLKKVAN